MGTPLMLECGAKPGQRVAVTCELLKRGADPILGDDLGNTALHFAAKAGDTDMMDINAPDKRTTSNAGPPWYGGDTPLFVAASKGKK